MNIVFWSDKPGMSSVSSSMLAIALIAATKYKIRCSAMQLQHADSSLISTILAPRDSEGVAEFDNTGIDSLARLGRGGSALPEDVEATTLSFAGRMFNLLVNSRQVDEKIYQNDMLPNLSNMFSLLNTTFQLNFIDVPAGVNKYSAEALKAADLIVICLPQSKQYVKQFFDRHSFNREKVFFMFGDYDAARNLNSENFSRMYRKNMKTGRCLTVPHCTDFANAMDNSKIISFFMQNLECKRSDSNFEFIRMCSNSVEKLLKAGGMVR